MLATTTTSLDKSGDRIIVGSVTATDPNVWQTLTYEITNGITVAALATNATTAVDVTNGT
jgi:hypothetical protein